MSTNTAALNTPVTLARATVCWMGGLGYVVRHVRDLQITIRPCAQFGHAVVARFVERGKRKVRGLVQTDHPSLVVLEGWVDLYVPRPLHEETDLDGATEFVADYNPERDADTFETALQAGGHTPVRDFRRHNPYSGVLETA